MVKSGGLTQHYAVKQDKINKVWHVYDNWKGEINRTVRTRSMARRYVNGLNKGWITDEMEKEAGRDNATEGEARQGPESSS
jgi:hypothetical protein